MNGSNSEFLPGGIFLWILEKTGVNESGTAISDGLWIFLMFQVVFVSVLVKIFKYHKILCFDKF